MAVDVLVIALGVLSGWIVFQFGFRLGRASAVGQSWLDPWAQKDYTPRDGLDGQLSKLEGWKYSFLDRMIHQIRWNCSSSYRMQISVDDIFSFEFEVDGNQYSGGYLIYAGKDGYCYIEELLSAYPEPMVRVRSKNANLLRDYLWGISGDLRKKIPKWKREIQTRIDKMSK